MSLSDRTPGYRNKSQVPPMASRPSSTEKLLPGQRICRWTAAPIPEIPAPTMITSKDSIFQRPYIKQSPDHFSRAKHVLQGNAPRNLTLSRTPIASAKSERAYAPHCVGIRDTNFQL